MSKMQFELDFDQVNVVLAGLSKLPIEQGVGVFMYIKTHAEQQLAATQPQAEEAPAQDGAGE